ncbi:MAG: GGDEF domain-containing protein [Candidatus Omnitrophota bacterium]
MRINFFRYLKIKIASALYRRSAEARFSKMEKLNRLSVKKSDERPVSQGHNVDKIKPDSFEKKYTPRRLLLILVLLILICGFLIKYLFLWFPMLHERNMPLIVSSLLIIILSPVLYAFFYTPMVREYDKLRKSEGRMRELALMDVLTGLCNRRGFLTYADQLLKLSDRTKRGLILIYADLDNMKAINDELGHDEGDRALTTVGDVLKMTFRSSDVVGRVGGDEFAILALEAKAESLDALRKRLKENLKRTTYNEGATHQLTVSLGIIYYDPEKPQPIEELLRRADGLMYREKLSV